MDYIRNDYETILERKEAQQEVVIPAIFLKKDLIKY